MTSEFEDSLESFGLTKSETKVLISLIETGPSNATEIASKIKMHRPNTYDILKSLENKGFIKRVIINKNILYKHVSSSELIELATFHQNLYNTKIEKIISLAKNLKALQKNEQKLEIEIYTGFKGARLVLFDSLEETKKTKKEILGIGVRNYRFLKEDSIYYKRYMEQRNKLNPKSRYILQKNEKMLIHKNTKVKTLDKLEQNLTAMYIYGDTTTIWLWYEDPIIIVLNNKEVTNANRTYFEYLWKNSCPCKNI